MRVPFWTNERTNELELSGTIRWMKLGDICLHSYSGATPKKSNDEYYTNGTIPWIRTQDVVFNNIYKVDAYITEKQSKKQELNGFQKIVL